MMETKKEREEKFGLLKQKFELMKAEILELSKQYLEDSSKELFDTYPLLKSYSWTQYTPYFNDGDECVFSANCFREAIQLDYDDFYIDGYEVEDNSDAYDITEKASAMLTEVQDELRNMFGDHVKIIVSRSGIGIEEYEHD